jgi:hypothetical protein
VFIPGKFAGSKEGKQITSALAACRADGNHVTRQAPLKAKYREDPQPAKITLSACGRLVEEGIRCKVETGRKIAEAGLHPATGGDGSLACAGVTLKAVATAIGVPIRNGSIKAEEDRDFRGTLGVTKEAPVGFTDFRLVFRLDTDAASEQLAALLKLTERYCVVYQTLRGVLRMTVSRDAADG